MFIICYCYFGYGTIRLKKDHDAKVSASSSHNNGYSQNWRVEIANHALRPGVPVRSAPTSRLPSPVFSPERSTSADGVKCLSNCRDGISKNLNVKIVRYNCKLDVSPRSAPTSGPENSQFTDYFSSFWSPQNLQVSTVKVADSDPDNSSPQDPTKQSLQINLRSQSKFTFPSNHRSLPRYSREWLESNINAHPLPLPPGTVHHTTENLRAPSLKSQWEKGRRIGCGTFGKVYIATNR